VPREYLQRIRQGYYPDERSPDLLLIPAAPHFFGSLGTTSHSIPWDYVQNVPLVFYGPGFVREGATIDGRDGMTLADLAPTVAELLKTDFPSDRPGRAIEGVFLPEEERGVPKLVLQVVWDGGGWDVLETWPDAWPNLKGMMDSGTSVEGVTLGSSPAVTPATHATMGTGAYPKQHGITNIPVRRNGRMGQAFPLGSGVNLELPTLADLYDIATSNEAKVGILAYRFFHLGMMGQGAYLDGGDRDIAIIADSIPGDLNSNEKYFTFPEYLQTVPGFQSDIEATDVSDGERDGMWHGKPLSDYSIRRHSPVWVKYQTRLLKKVLQKEGFGDDEVTDLFYVNYKQIDDVGHTWNMLEPAMRDVLEPSDFALGRLEDLLNRSVGKRNWVIVVTADHGQVPHPIDMHVWPIHMGVFTRDIAEHFGMDYEDMFLSQQSAGFFLHKEALAAAGITLDEIADFILDYKVKDNADPLPKGFRDQAERYLFAAAIPSDEMSRVWACAK
jgi:hypothetical protein